MITKCPNKNLPEYKKLEELFGEGRALSAWTLHGEDKIPTPVEAIRHLYPNVHPTDTLITMDFKDWEGDYEPDHEKEIDDYILNHPDKKINGGDSFNGFLDRSLGTFRQILDTAPDNSVIISHSALLKAFLLWDKAGRPENLRVDNKAYTQKQTQTGDIEKFKGTNGQTIWVVRHGQTEDNLKGNLRSADTKLTDEGIKDAQKAAKTLSKVQISQVYCSPLDRVLHTTDIIMDKQEPGEKYSDIKLVEPTHEDFSHLADFGERYQAISKRKSELERQGAQISQLGATGFNWIPRQNINYQKLTTGQKFRYDIQTRIKRAILGGQQEGLIGNALYIIRGSQKASGHTQGDGQAMDSLWKKLNQGNLIYKRELEAEDYIDAGGEHTVYSGSTDETVIKLRYNLPLDEQEVFLKNLIAHNQLFPNTAYILLGYKRNGEYIQPVLSQRRIKSTDNIYKPEVIEAVLNSLGFRKYDEDSFINDETGTLITDLKPSNVIFVNGVPEFIDPKILINPKFYNELENINYQLDNNKTSKQIKYELQSRVNQVLSGEDKTDIIQTAGSIIRAVERGRSEGEGNGKDMERLWRQVQNSSLQSVQLFLKRIGASATWVPDTGQDYKETIDTLRGAIELVEGRADAKTLGHAAIHQYIALLPKESKLYKEIIRRGELNPDYDDVYNQYKDDKNYQNPDGSVNEEKMNGESFVHMADDVLVQRAKDKAVQTLWDKFLQWLKEVVQKIKEVLGGKELSTENLPEDIVAEDILGNDIGKLSKEKIKKMREAAEKGEIYYEMKPEMMDYINELKKDNCS